ncbi:MAG: hypothetical protein V4629_11240 [Pseudomonadota bacterium]
MSAEIIISDWMQQLGVDIWLPRVVCANAKSAPTYSAVPFSAAAVVNQASVSNKRIISNKKVETNQTERKILFEKDLIAPINQRPTVTPKLSIEKPLIKPVTKKESVAVSPEVSENIFTLDEPVFKIHILIRALTPRWLLLAEASSDDAEFSDAEYETIFNLQRALESDPSVQPVFQQSWLSWPPNIGFSSPAEAKQWFAPDQLKAALRGLLKNRSWSSYTHLLVLGDRLTKILTEKDVATETIVINNPRKTLIAYRTIATMIKQPSYRKTLWETLKPLR